MAETAARLVRLLSYCRPRAADRGSPHRVYPLVAGTTVPTLLLDDEEAVAIGVGLRMIAAQPIGRLEEASVRALARREHWRTFRLGRIERPERIVIRSERVQPSPADPGASTPTASRRARIYFTAFGTS